MKGKSDFSSKKISAKIKKNSGTTKRSKSPNKKDKKNEKMYIFENQEIKRDLQSFYDKEAKKYAETRKKFWHEEKAILDAITPLFDTSSFWTKWRILGDTKKSSANTSEWQDIPPIFKDGGWKSGDFKILSPSDNSFTKEQNKKTRILEFWCGSGRFASLLSQNFNNFEYIWIDLSKELISYAKKENPDLTFMQWDITELIKNFEQESFDLIVWTSSFQHIPTIKERSFLMKNFYRLLDYDWTVLMTNRSLSKWFIKKHWKVVLKAKISSLLHFNKNKARDLMVPRTDKEWKVYERFYHFFSLKELENLSKFSWLSLKVNKFLDENGEFTDNEKISRSSLFVAKKKPIEW